MDNTTNKIIYVDIDDTICRYDNEGEKNNLDYSKAIPIQKNIDIVNKLYDDGNQITYYTARGALTKTDWTELTANQLNKWGCKFHNLRLDKPFFDILIDDRAFNNFEELKKSLKQN